MAIPLDTPLDTPLFFIPIRFWEPKYYIETGTLVKTKSIDPSVQYPSVSKGHVYAFVDEFGHNAYMSQEDTFLTLEEAIATREEMIAQKKKEDEIEHKKLMKKIFAAMKKEA